MQKQHKTIVLSDIHLGTRWSKTKEVIRFLRKNSCETLILCGDIIDGWSLTRGKKDKWKRVHTNFLKLLLELEKTTKIVYLRGNHDDFLDSVIPVNFGNIEVVRDYIYTSFGVRYYVLHGDVFDKITTRMGWLARVGDICYSILLWWNKIYNTRRIRRGLPYYSLAQEVKNRIKLSVSYISDYQAHIVEVAKAKKCQGVICGHIHHPEKRYYDDILYLNAGDWIESLSALTQDHQGNWAVVIYGDQAAASPIT